MPSPGRPCKPTARTGATCRWSPSIRPTPRTMTTRSMPSPTRPGQSGRRHRHRRDRRCRWLCAAGHGARPRGAEARQFGLFPRPRRADAARAHLQRSVLAARGRGPPCPCRAHGVLPRTAARSSHTFHRIMMRSHAKLSYQQAQAAIDGHGDGKAAPLLEPILKPLWAAYAIAQARARPPPAAGTRPARAQDPAQAGRHGRPGHRAGAARRAQADRGNHDPGQCRGGRDAGAQASRRWSIASTTRPRWPSRNRCANSCKSLEHLAGARRQSARIQFNSILAQVAGCRPRGTGQRGGAALAKPGRYTPGKYRPFRA